MNEKQLKMQLRATVQSIINDLMMQNHISASQMEEALEHVLLQIKDAATLEYVEWAINDKNEAVQAIQTPKEEEKQIPEEE